MRAAGTFESSGRFRGMSDRRGSPCVWRQSSCPNWGPVRTSRSSSATGSPSAATRSGRGIGWSRCSSGPATFDVPSPTSGRLAAIHGREDDRVTPGMVLGLVAVMEDGDGDADRASRRRAVAHHDRHPRELRRRDPLPARRRPGPALPRPPLRHRAEPPRQVGVPQGRDGGRRDHPRHRRPRIPRGDRAGRLDLSRRLRAEPDLHLRPPRPQGPQDRHLLPRRGRRATPRRSSRSSTSRTTPATGSAGAPSTRSPGCSTTPRSARSSPRPTDGWTRERRGDLDPSRGPSIADVGSVGSLGPSSDSVNPLPAASRRACGAAGRRRGTSSRWRRPRCSAPRRSPCCPAPRRSGRGCSAAR